MFGDSISPVWAVVVAALTGALAGLLGGYVQRRWEERNRQVERIADVCVRLLSAPLIMMFPLGTYASPSIRRFFRFRTRYAFAYFFPRLEASLEEIARAKSELDLKVADIHVRNAANQLLEASSRFVELATDERAPHSQAIDDATANLSEARTELEVVTSAYLAKARRTLIGRVLKRR